MYVCGVRVRVCVFAFFLISDSGYLTGSKWERKGDGIRKGSTRQDSNSRHPKCNCSICWHAAHEGIGPESKAVLNGWLLGCSKWFLCSG